MKARRRDRAAEDVVALLAQRYAPPAWAFLPQVRSQTGYSRSFERYADGLAMSLWPSRGLELIGLEVKVDRGDWLRELVSPQKAEFFWQHCDRWYVVAPAGVVQDGEVPSTWGHLEVQGTTRLVQKVEAPRNPEPKPLDRPLLAAILRRAVAVICPQSRLDASYQRGLEAGKKDRDQVAEWDKRQVEDDLKLLQKRVNDFHRAYGVDINTWSAGDIGMAVRLVLRGTPMLQQLQELRKTAAQIIETVDQALTDAPPKMAGDRS